MKRIKEEYSYTHQKYWPFTDVGKFWDTVIDYDEINKKADSYSRRFVDGYNLSNIADGSYILDICARTGNGTLYFWQREKVKKALCADFSDQMLKICASRLKEAGVLFECLKVESLPLVFKDGEFDAVLCFETVEHISNPGDFIKELSRVIRLGGQMILTTPNTSWGFIHTLSAIFNLHHSEGPHRFIGRKTLRKFVEESGFKIITEKTCVLVPAGPRFLISLGAWLEKVIGNQAMSLFGLRRIFICEKI